jgi:hypothetical protein
VGRCKPSGRSCSPGRELRRLDFKGTIQLADAAFGPYAAAEQPIDSWWEYPTVDGHLPALPGVRTFDDRITYVDDSWASWFDREANPLSALLRNSINSVDTPTYGLKITVGKNSSLQAGKIKVNFTGFTP